MDQVHLKIMDNQQHEESAVIEEAEDSSASATPQGLLKTFPGLIEISDLKFALIRKAYARGLEITLRDQGIHVEITTLGELNDTLKIKWDQKSKFEVHQISKTEVLKEATELRFKEIILTDGSETNLGESWSWDLTK